MGGIFEVFRGGGGGEGGIGFIHTGIENDCFNNLVIIANVSLLLNI